MMRGFIFIAFLLTAGYTAKATTALQKFDKAGFYNVMAQGNLDAINAELEAVKDAPNKDNVGYEGALLMKKAGLVKKAKDKLAFFKEGRIKLETTLLADPDNTELRFLRLAIEEHAPKIVRYHADIEKDKTFIIANFKNVSLTVQHAILDYCKNSKVLHKEDL